MPDPFASPRDEGPLFAASYDGECAEGCPIFEGDMVGYLWGDLLCERCFQEQR